MMAPKATLRRDDISSFIDQLYDSDLHAKPVLSLANATQGVLTSASLAVHAVGQGLAQAQGTLSKPFAFERGEEALRHGVVEAVSDRAHRRLHVPLTTPCSRCANEVD